MLQGGLLPLSRNKNFLSPSQLCCQESQSNFTARFSYLIHVQGRPYLHLHTPTLVFAVLFFNGLFV